MAERIPVFFEGQDDLVDILATAMCSICYNTASFIEFYVLDCGICPFNKKQLESLKSKFDNFSIEFLPVDLKRFEGMKGWKAGNFLDCYARLLIPELKPDIDRAIYLDSDVIALDDIKLLWDQDLDGFETGLVADIGYGDDSSFFENCTQNLGVPAEHIYANAGMFLIDCKQWREHGTSEKLLEIGRKFKDKLLILNEDILSVYYAPNRYKRLENRFNLADLNSRVARYGITDDYLADEWKNVVIYHFCHGKPFKQIKNNFTGKTIRHFDAFWFFAQMTPFYAGMQLRMNEDLRAVLVAKTKYSLFGILPILSVRRKNGKTLYKLFGILPVMKKKES